MINAHTNSQGVSNVLTQHNLLQVVIWFEDEDEMSQPDVNMLFRIQLFGFPVIIRYAGKGNTIGCLGYGPPYNIGKHQSETLLGKNMRL